MTKEERITFVIKILETAIVKTTLKEPFVMNALRIIMIFRHAKLVIVTRKEVRTRLVMSIVEIAIVCPIFVVKNVTNVNVITIRIHFRIAKVSEFLQKVESSLSILILECNCFAIGTKKNTACDAINGKCSCKVGYVGDKCDTCDNGYFKLLNGVCEGM